MTYQDHHVVAGQRLEDFWGMREFYATVRFVNRALQSTSDPGISNTGGGGVREYNTRLEANKNTHFIRVNI